MSFFQNTSPVRTRTRTLFWLGVILSLIGLGCERNSPTSPPPAVQPAVVKRDSHSQMVSLLADKARLFARVHPILGDGKVRALRDKLAARRSEPWSLELLELHSQLGHAELEQGHAARAIELFEAVLNGLRHLGQQRTLPTALETEARYNLGIAHMRRGETINCCQRNSPASCLLPIGADGVHVQPEHSQRAIVQFMRVLELTKPDTPLHYKARWLLNVMHMTVGTYPKGVPTTLRIAPEVFASDETFPRFPNIAQSLGIDAFDLLGGAVADDFDGDGDLDLVTSTYDLTGSLRFYRNEQNGTFTDRTEAANLKGIVGGFNLMQADYDNDGDLDLLVLRGAWMGRIPQLPNSLLQNDGRGRFTDVTFAAGLGTVHYPTQTAAWADYDLDGDLDVFIGNEKLDRTKNAPCQLFQNQGGGIFVDVAQRAGVINDGFTKGVTWGDFDGDRWPDLYVSNLGSDNRLYRNNGDGTFTDIAPAAGVTGPAKSFPVWFWDFNNDGALDLYVSSYNWNDGNLAAVVASRLGHPTKLDGARLYKGDGRGKFRDVARAQNLTHLTLPMGVNFGDLDNDGFLDFYLGTGYPEYEALMPNVMYRNKRGHGFADVTTAGGFGHLQKGHGVVFADLDHDGDQDVFAQMGGFLPGDKFYNALFENPGFENSWIAIQLVGTRSNRSAIGARIHIAITEDGQSRSIYRHVNSGGSFGANPLRQTIGLGTAKRIDRLEIFWPTTGKTQTFPNLAANRFIRITEGRDELTPIELKPFRLKGSAKK